MVSVKDMRQAANFDPEIWYSQHSKAYDALWGDSDTSALDEFCKLFLPGSSIVDIACGTGRDLAAGVRNGMNMTGFDIARGQVDLASAHAPAAQASFCALPCPDASFDGVWAHAAVVHCNDEDLEKGLAEMLRVLPKGGLLWIDTKSRDGSVDSDGFDTQGRWFCLRDLESFKDSVRGTGFEILNASSVADFKRDHVQWVQILATKVS